ncbi:DUF5615 family PIN-like protein [Scytonema sp. NUACC26]|uniref:DUF5615 family PIN-like protein n=1 Tax=Scytonema sp. NUACC26 TaxID=3140176 RepID=UPI0034DBC6E8
MKILIDMNLSPNWVGVFERYDIESIHWSSFGDPRERDVVIMEWARSNGYIVFTHDLDFGSLTKPDFWQVDTAWFSEIKEHAINNTSRTN